MTNKNKEILEQTRKVIYHTIQDAKNKDCLDNPYHCAVEIIDLIEWLSPTVGDQKKIANLVLRGYNWQEGTGIEVRKYFNLLY